MVWEYFFVPFSRVPVYRNSIGLDRLIVEWQMKQRVGTQKRTQFERDAREALAGRSPSADRVVNDFLTVMIGKGYPQRAVQEAAEFVGMPAAKRRTIAHYTKGKIADGTFLYTLVPMRMRTEVFEALADKSAEAQAAIIPEPTDDAARQYFQGIFIENVRRFAERIAALTAELPGRGTCEEQYVRNLSDLRSLFRKQLGKKAKCVEVLSKAMALSDHAYVGRTIDVLAHLHPPGGSWGYEGWSMRVKSNESIARKWAKKMRTLAELAQRTNDPTAFPLSFEELTITDVLGATFIPYERDAEDVERRLTEANLITLERIDSHMHTIRSDAWQVQLKVYDPREKLVYDIHIATLGDMLELEFGKSAHHLRTTRRHQENMRDPLYRMAYERALEFLDACNLPGIDPKLQQVVGEQDPYRRRVLLQLEEEHLFHNQFGLTQEEIRLLRQLPAHYLRSIEGEPEDRRTLERVLDGYLWAYDDALSIGLTAYQREPIFQKYLLNPEIRALQEEILLLDQLYEKIYPKSKGLGEQRAAFRRELPYLQTAGEILYRTDLLQQVVRAAVGRKYAPDQGVTLDQSIREARALFGSALPKKSGHGQRMLLEAQITAAAVALEGYAILLQNAEERMQHLQTAKTYLTQISNRVERLWPDAASNVQSYGAAFGMLRKALAEISPPVSDGPSERS